MMDTALWSLPDNEVSDSELVASAAILTQSQAAVTPNFKPIQQGHASCPVKPGLSIKSHTVMEV